MGSGILQASAGSHFGESTRPYSDARPIRSNVDQAADAIFEIASSPERSLSRYVVITQSTKGRFGAKTIRIEVPQQDLVAFCWAEETDTRSGVAARPRITVDLTATS
jgi:hypothetical protein